MGEIDASWDLLGPLPVDAKLEERLSSVKHINDHPKADEAVWEARARESARIMADSEAVFMEELVRRTRRDAA